MARIPRNHITTKNERLRSAVAAAVDDLFSDTTVTQEETAEALSEIISYCETKLVCIREDIAREKHGCDL